MKNYYTLLLLLVLTFGGNQYKAQESQGEFVVTAGAGVSGGVLIFKGLINVALQEEGLEKLRATPIINGMADYAITDNFSMGAAYSYNHLKWNDNYTSVSYVYDSTNTVVVDSTVTTQTGFVRFTRQNIGIRPLFHFGNGDDLDMYAGARLGFSMWNASYEYNDGANNSDSGITPKTSVFSVQALFGIRKYFNDNFGLNFEIGIGNSPYFIGGGVNFRI